MNGVHNYHKNIKVYVLRCTTIRLKQERGHETSRRANMNLWFKPHFTGKIGSVFPHYVAENEIVCWCYLAPFMFICSVAYRYVCLYTYREGYSNINQVIGIILLAISPTVEIYRVGDNRRTVNTSTVRIFWSVGDKKRVLSIVMLIYRHDMRSGLQ